MVFCCFFFWCCRFFRIIVFVVVVVPVEMCTILFFFLWVLFIAQQLLFWYISRSDIGKYMIYLCVFLYAFGMLGGLSCFFLLCIYIRLFSARGNNAFWWFWFLLVVNSHARARSSTRIYVGGRGFWVGKMGKGVGTFGADPARSQPVKNRNVCQDVNHNRWRDDFLRWFISFSKKKKNTSLLVLPRTPVKCNHSGLNVNWIINVRSVTLYSFQSAAAKRWLDDSIKI